MSCFDGVRFFVLCWGLYSVLAERHLVYIMRFNAPLQQQRKLPTNRRLIAAKLQAEHGLATAYLIEYAKWAQSAETPGDYHIFVPVYTYICTWFHSFVKRSISLQGAWWQRRLNYEYIIHYLKYYLTYLYCISIPYIYIVIDIWLNQMEWRNRLNTP